MIEDDENELPVKCCGEALGTTDCIEMTNKIKYLLTYM